MESAGSVIRHRLVTELLSCDEQVIAFEREGLMKIEKTGHYHSGPAILVPFLIRAGYARHPAVCDWFLTRLNALYRTAQEGNYDLYLSKPETAGMPKAWRDKPIYRPEHDAEGPCPLPTCYDFYAMAYFPRKDPETLRRMESVVGYLSHRAFQATPGGYHWDNATRRCWAAGRTYLACCNPERRVLFLELAAPFASGRKSAWFAQGVADLERFRTPRDTYRFPADYLKERPNGYYLYAGSHMGLGEDRRRPLGIEIESTFRMLRLKQVAGMADQQ